MNHPFFVYEHKTDPTLISSFPTYERAESFARKLSGATGMRYIVVSLISNKVVFDTVHGAV